MFPPRRDASRTAAWSIDPLLTLAVLAAPLVAGWGVWLLGLHHAGCLGSPPHAGCPRLDFAAFWGAGLLADAGRASSAYDWPQLAARLTREFALDGGRPLPFLYPPPALLMAAVLGRAQYGTAFALWTAGGLALYLGAGFAVGRRPAALVAALGPAGVFFCLFAGQNGLLTAASLAFAMLCLERRPVLAGVCLALFACKPQLALLAPVALIAGRRWRALSAMGATYAFLCAVAVVVFGQGVLSAFLRGAMTGGGAFAHEGWLDWWRVQSLYGIMRWAGVAATPALIGQGALSLGVVAAVWRIWSGPVCPDLQAASLAAGALLATPYAFIYDGPLAAVAALFIVRDAKIGPALDSADLLLVAIGLLGQSVFVAAATPLAGPATAAALFATACRRAWVRRRDVASFPSSFPAPSAAP